MVDGADSRTAIGVVSGLVLAGGRGRRLGGIDKGLLELHGQPLAARALARLDKYARHVLISANRHLDTYATLGARLVHDDPPGRGPLGGMLAGLRACPTDWLLCLPCDMPHLPEDLEPRMLASLSGPQPGPAFAHDGERLQPLVALLPRSAAPDLQRFLDGGGRRAEDWARGQGGLIIRFEGRRDAFANLNTPEDLAAARARADGCMG
ncbi:MAG: molybdenum cofactor guanylyltransferase MobA [Steroidobacteraceae bacterium]